MEKDIKMTQNEKEIKMTAVEKQEERLKRLQQEIIIAKKKVEDAKNKETLKIWKKIKPLFLDEEILAKIPNKDFIEEIYLEVEEILKKYKTEKEVKESDLVE